MAGQLAANPFKKVELGLWSILEASTQFTTLVRSGNRIKFCLDDNPDPEKDVSIDGDLPAVRIVPTNCKMADRGTNCTLITQEFSIEIFTGDKRTTWYYSDVKWAIHLAIIKTFGTTPTDWNMPTGTALTKIWYGSASDELQDGDGIRQGWVSAMNVEVDFTVNEAVCTA